MRTKNGGVTSEVVKTVGDDGNHNVQHNKRTQEDESDEVKVGDGRAAALLGISHVELSVLGVVPLVSFGITRTSIHGGHHNIGPGLARRTSEQHYFCLENISKVVMSVNFCFWVIRNIAKHLHSYNCIDEEQHQHQHHHIWKSLEKRNYVSLSPASCFLAEDPHLDRLHKCIEKNSDTNRPSEQLDQPRCPKQPQESDLNYSSSVNDTTSHCYKVECIPSVFKIRLKKRFHYLMKVVLTWNRVFLTFGPKDEILRTHSTVNIAVNIRFKSARMSENSSGAP